jgi:Fic family protein
MGTKPSAEVINCQRVDATESGEISGLEAGKKVKRHKGQILTNTNGFLVGAAIHCAGMHSPMRRLALLISAGDTEIMRYIHERDAWPKFHWQAEALETSLAHVRHRQGRLIGRTEALGFKLRAEAVLQTFTEDVIKTSDIEGEQLDKEQVRSSIARRLGMDIAGLVPAEHHVEGIVEMMLDATQNYQKPLTEDRLFAWHASLFPSGRSGMTKIIVGHWRSAATGPMQVVSGAIGPEKVHFEAPAADRLAGEMAQFLAWFESETKIDPVIKAGIAHLWFVTIHPFEDGNGRIARAIADLELAQTEISAQRFYSMSSQIRIERNRYYDMLETTQKGGLDITPWLQWFLDCLSRAFDIADETMNAVMTKARFWETIKGKPLNERQLLVLNRFLDGFDGKLTSSKWAKLAKCSQDTASRDIDDLVRKGILQRSAAGGRSTSYEIVLHEA